MDEGPAEAGHHSLAPPEEPQTQPTRGVVSQIDGFVWALWRGSLDGMQGVHYRTGSEKPDSLCPDVPLAVSTLSRQRPRSGLIRVAVSARPRRGLWRVRGQGERTVPG